MRTVDARLKPVPSEVTPSGGQQYKALCGNCGRYITMVGPPFRRSDDDPYLIDRRSYRLDEDGIWRPTRYHEKERARRRAKNADIGMYGGMRGAGRRGWPTLRFEDGSTLLEVARAIPESTFKFEELSKLPVKIQCDRCSAINEVKLVTP